MLKRTIPLFITGAAGGILILAYFSPATTNWGEVVTDWMNTLAAVAFILGGGNLLFVNLEKISSKRPGWAYALVTLLAFVVTLAFGVLKIGAVPNAQFPATPWAGDYESVRAPFGWVYEYVLSSIPCEEHRGDSVARHCVRDLARSNCSGGNSYWLDFTRRTVRIFATRHDGRQHHAVREYCGNTRCDDGHCVGHRGDESSSHSWNRSVLLGQ